MPNHRRRVQIKKQIHTNNNPDQPKGQGRKNLPALSMYSRWE